MRGRGGGLGLAAFVSRGAVRAARRRRVNDEDDD